MDSIFHRVSIRKYEAKEVEQEKIERIEAIQNMIKYDVSKGKILHDYSEEEYNEAVKSMLVEA